MAVSVWNHTFLGVCLWYLRVISKHRGCALTSWKNLGSLGKKNVGLHQNQNWVCRSLKRHLKSHQGYYAKIWHYICFGCFGFFFFFFLFFFFGLFRAAPAAYGGSQARGWIGRYSRQPPPQLTAASSLTHWARPGIILMDPSRFC